jgi:hypothetical protein
MILSGFAERPLLPILHNNRLSEVVAEQTQTSFSCLTKDPLCNDISACRFASYYAREHVRLSFYQIVFTFEARIFPSRLRTGTPKIAVAATTRSGISGTFARRTCHIASTISTVKGASSNTWSGPSRAAFRSV